MRSWHRYCWLGMLKEARKRLHVKAFERPSGRIRTLWLQRVCLLTERDFNVYVKTHYVLEPFTSLWYIRTFFKKGGYQKISTRFWKQTHEYNLVPQKVKFHLSLFTRARTHTHTHNLPSFYASYKRKHSEKGATVGTSSEVNIHKSTPSGVLHKLGETFNELMRWSRFKPIAYYVRTIRTCNDQRIDDIMSIIFVTRISKCSFTCSCFHSSFQVSFMWLFTSTANFVLGTTLTVENRLVQPQSASSIFRFLIAFIINFLVISRCLSQQDKFMITN